MIQDGLYLASDTLIGAIYTFSGKVDSKSITIGKSLLEDIPIRILGYLRQYGEREI